MRTISPSNSAVHRGPDSDNRLAYIYNKVADCIFLLSVEPDDCYRFLSINESFITITGLQRDEIIGKRIEEVLPESAHALVLGKYREAIQENKMVSWEEVSVFPAGLRIGEVSVTPTKDEEGNCIQLLGVVHDVTVSRQAEGDLRRNEERLRLALESARMGVWDWNIRENKMEWAVNLESTFGLERNTFGGTYEAVLELVHVEDRDRMKEEVNQALKRGGDYKIEYRASLPNGEVRWICTEGSIVKNEQGRTSRMLGINVDITERKLGDAKRREAEELLASALRTSREGFVLLRLRDEMVLDANDGWLKLVGFKRKDAVGKTTAEIKVWGNPADQERFAAMMREHGSVQDFEFTYRTRLGEVRDASFSAEVVNAGGEPCALVIGRDITERKRAEERLRQSEARLRRLVESNIIGVIIADFQGLVSMANDAYLQMTGYSHEDLLLGKIRWTEMTPPEYRAKDELAKTELLATGKCTPYEKEYICKDGGRIPIIIGIALLEERKDDCVAFILNLVERKRFENELEASREQLRQLTERVQYAREEESTRIARELHDELGQALTGIVIDLSWLEEKLFEDPPTVDKTKLIEKIRSATKQAHATVNTVRRLATELRPGLLDDFGVAAAVEWQAQEFQERTGVICQVETNLTRTDLPADLSTAVFRIFQEALTNVARHAHASSVRVVLKETDGSILLEVKDDGRGVSEAELRGARSLGVTGMRERALLLNGEMKITGSPEAGTTVRVSIPLVSSNGPRSK